MRRKVVHERDFRRLSRALGYRREDCLFVEEHPDGLLLLRKRPGRAGRPNAPRRDWKANGTECAASGPENSGRADPELTEDLRRVIEELDRFYRGDRERIAAFLGRPHLSLDGRTPFDVARSGPGGAERVLEIIGRAAAGVAI